MAQQIRAVVRDANGDTVSDMTLNPHDVPMLVLSTLEDALSFVLNRPDGSTTTWERAGDGWS